ncbi:STAS domain-containing protein [Micromonospora sp. KC723]|uniref:STAS domain-containing protein n=1 Tax=Micromonospora sp. KC723 TaxID=2530381 RepID=UPI001FB5BB7F|nr:STAS domain-containing protein [Micromonospora sp. KC723]
MLAGRKPEATPLGLSVDRSDPDRPVISVSGDLAFATAGPLRAEVDQALAERPAVIVLDFAELLFIDSTGLSVIVHAWREGQQCGTAIRLRSTPRFLDAILDMTGITGLLARPPVNTATGSGTLPDRSAATA